MTHEAESASCPQCGSKGRQLVRAALETQLRKEAVGVSQDLNGYRFCGTPGCDVVYFKYGSDSFVRSDLTLPVFQKSADPRRFVCCCFQHRVGEIMREIAASGVSVVPAEIKAKCKAGLDECETKNPQGACCLGNVLALVRQAKGALPTPQDDCCSGGKRGSVSSR